MPAAIFLVDSTAKKMAADFFGKFSAVVVGTEDVEAVPEPVAAPRAQGLSPLVWIVGLIVIVGVLLLIFAG